MSPMAKCYLGKIKNSKETVLNETLASQLPGRLVSPSDIWKKLPHTVGEGRRVNFCLLVSFFDKMKL